jgi:hypothetical protein
MDRDEIVIRVFVTLVCATILALGHPGWFGAAWFVWLGIMTWAAGTRLMPKKSYRQWMAGAVTLALGALWFAEATGRLA